MISDKLLQIAADFSLTSISSSVPLTGYTYATDTISFSELRDVGRGQPLYCVVSVKENITTSAAAGDVLLRFSLGAVSTGFSPASALSIKLAPTIGCSSFFSVKSVAGNTVLKAGKKIAFAINPHAFKEYYVNTATAADQLFDGKGYDQVFFGVEAHQTSAIASAFYPATAVITAGKVDVDIALLAHAGTVDGKSEEPFYPSAFVVR